MSLDLDDFKAFTFYAKLTCSMYNLQMVLTYCIFLCFLKKTIMYILQAVLDDTTWLKVHK